VSLLNYDEASLEFILGQPKRCILVLLKFFHQCEKQNAKSTKEAQKIVKASLRFLANHLGLFAVDKVQ
jgi:DNA replicative helicase MCM subunit Mcm2 (Cdc46/Mcm family)